MRPRNATYWFIESRIMRSHMVVVFPVLFLLMLPTSAAQTVAALYRSGLLPKPANYAYPFLNLLAFHDAPNTIEQKLFVMFLEHRMRTFQGTFHADYSMWYGWSEMQRDLTEINEMAAEIRRTGHAPSTISVAPVTSQAAKPQ